MALQPGTIIDRYIVEAALGRGGMAEVYAVRHRQLGSLHALKILTTPSSDVRERLLQEGRVQAQLRHPNIVSVTDVVDISGSPGLVMEYISGPTLGGLISALQFPLPQVDRLARGILSGVAAAHDHGLVHRDLKPANILIDIHEGNLVPKVADFGLVKIVSGEDAAEHSMTRSGAAMGTPSFMAPEQIRDTKTVDHRADLFSLGAILYELTSGNRAFRGRDMMEIFTAVVTGDFEPVEQVASDVPQRMVDAINWALQVDVDERVPHCKELLSTWCDGSIHTFPWDADELQWPEKSVELARSQGTASLTGGGASSQAPDSNTWSGDVDALFQPSMAQGAAGGPEGLQVETSADTPTPPRPIHIGDASNVTVQPPLDGSLAPDNRAPHPDELTKKKPRTSGAVVGLASLALAAAAGWWWTSQPTTDPAPSQGIRFRPTAPAPPPNTAVEAAEAPADPPEEVAPEAPPQPLEPPEAPPTPPAPEATGASEPAPPTEEPAEPATPPPAAPSTASFSWTGNVESVRVRNEAGNLFGAGTLEPGTYSIYIRRDGSLRRVGSMTLSAGQHRNLTCNPLGCQ